MSNYTALIAAWNNVTQPPPGVTGTGLLGGDTTAQKITKVNAWTVVGSVPTSFFVTGNQLVNCVNYAEFKALSTTQQLNLLSMFACPGNLLGGSANTTFLVDGMILDYFNVAGPTVAALTALAKGTVQAWWQAPVASNGGGLTGPVSLADTQAAGLV
jgi:hypothetical protein